MMLLAVDLGLTDSFALSSVHAYPTFRSLIAMKTLVFYLLNYRFIVWFVSCLLSFSGQSKARFVNLFPVASAL